MQKFENNYHLHRARQSYRHRWCIPPPPPPTNTFVKAMVSTKVRSTMLFLVGCHAILNFIHVSHVVRKDQRNDSIGRTVSSLVMHLQQLPNDLSLTTDRATKTQEAQPKAAVTALTLPLPNGNEESSTNRTQNRNTVVNDVEANAVNEGKESKQMWKTLLNGTHDNKWILNDDDPFISSNSGPHNDSNEHHNQNHTEHIIPRMIYKIFLSEDEDHKKLNLSNVEDLSAPQRRALQSWTNRNSGYNMTLFGLEDCRSYLKKYFHPIFLRAFECISAYAGKANLFRAAVVYREGGWYSDWMEEVMVDGLLNRLSEGRTTFVFPWARTKKHENRVGSIMNAFFGATPQHPMLAETLKVIVTNAQSEYYGLQPQDNTGQGAMGNGFKRFYHDEKSAKSSAFPITTGRYHARRDDYQFPKFSSETGIIRHYCEGCRAWTKERGANNYRTMHRKRTYYCARANELFDSEALGVKV